MSDIWPAVAFLCVWSIVCFQATKAYVLRRELSKDLNQRDKWVADYQRRNGAE